MPVEGEHHLQRLRQRFDARDLYSHGLSEEEERRRGKVVLSGIQLAARAARGACAASSKPGRARNGVVVKAAYDMRTAGGKREGRHCSVCSLT